MTRARPDRQAFFHHREAPFVEQARNSNRYRHASHCTPVRTGPRPRPGQPAPAVQPRTACFRRCRGANRGPNTSPQPMNALATSPLNRAHPGTLRFYKIAPPIRKPHLEL